MGEWVENKAKFRVSYKLSYGVSGLSGTMKAFQFSVYIFSCHTHSTGILIIIY